MKKEYKANSVKLGKSIIPSLLATNYSWQSWQNWQNMLFSFENRFRFNLEIKDKSIKKMLMQKTTKVLSCTCKNEVFLQKINRVQEPYKQLGYLKEEEFYSYLGL